jgi:hypothetical protein
MQSYNLLARTIQKLRSKGEKVDYVAMCNLLNSDEFQSGDHKFRKLDRRLQLHNKDGNIENYTKEKAPSRQHHHDANKRRAAEAHDNVGGKGWDIHST